MIRGLLLVLALAFATAAPAQNAGSDIEEIRDGAAVSLDPASAYLLIRTEVPPKALSYHIILVRELVAQESEDYFKAQDAMIAEERAKPGATEEKVQAATAKFVERYKKATNVLMMYQGRSYAKNTDGSTYLLRVRPGRYIIAGPGLVRGLNVCMCMGTVGFEAKPGVITDLGYVLAARVDKPSTVPELAETAGHPLDHGSLPLLFVMSVRPFQSNMAVPDQLLKLVRVPAPYYPVGKIPNLFTGLVSRMASVPGLLAYDVDRVIDPKTGQRVPDIEMP